MSIATLEPPVKQEASTDHGATPLPKWIKDVLGEPPKPSLYETLSEAVAPASFKAHEEEPVAKSYLDTVIKAFDVPRVLVAPQPDARSDADVLRDALGYLRRHGWTREKIIDPRTGAVCSAGAIALSQGWITPEDTKIPEQYLPQLLRLSERLMDAAQHRSSIPYAIYGLTTWNDHVAHGPMHVEAVFARAEQMARSEPPRRQVDEYVLHIQPLLPKSISEAIYA